MERIVPIFSLAIGKIAPKLSSIDSIHVVVSGAHAGKFSAVLPGFGIGIAGKHPSAHMSRPVTRIVEPPPPTLAAADDAPPPASDEATLLLPTFDRPIISPLKATARTAPLKGRVALLDISKPNGNLLLDTIEKQLAKYDVTTRYSKPAFAKPASRWQRIISHRRRDHRWPTEARARRASCTTSTMERAGVRAVAVASEEFADQGVTRAVLSG